MPESILEVALASVSDDSLRTRVRGALRPLGVVHSAEDLRSMVQNGGEKGRLAVLALGLLGDEDSVTILIDMLSDTTDDDVRAGVVAALGRSGRDDAGVAIAERLEMDEATSVRITAAHALANIPNDMSRSALLKTLKDDREEWMVLEAAAESLGYVGDREAIPALVHAATHSHPDVRFSAVYALGMVGGEAELQFLANVAREDRGVAIGGPVSDEARRAVSEIRLRQGDSS